MKKTLTILALILISFSAKSQLMHNLELGGSNHLGFGLTTEYRIKLYDENTEAKNRFHISPKIGIGYTLMNESAMTFQAGLAFGKENRWGHIMELNSNFSYLHASPFSSEFHQPSETYIPPLTNNQGDVLWYTGFDYRFEGKLNYTIGVGVNSVIDRNRFTGESSLRFRSPMLKLGIGF